MIRGDNIKLISCWYATKKICENLQHKTNEKQKLQSWKTFLLCKQRNGISDQHLSLGLHTVTPYSSLYTKPAAWNANVNSVRGAN